MNETNQSETGKIRTIIVKKAADAFISLQKVDHEWKKLNYLSSPDYALALEEYEDFIRILNTTVAEIFFLPENRDLSIDSIYVRDASIITDHGAILCQMGKKERVGESQALGELYQQLGIPVLGEIEGAGRIEGGDMIWLDRETLVVGRGYRTNDEGIRQLQVLTKDFVKNFIVVPLPHYLGKTDVFHLMSIISPIDSDLAVVYSKLMPVPFREFLLSRKIELVEVPDFEFDTMGCNILALAPRKALMLSGNPVTKARLESKGVEVIEYDGMEISRKGCGGPTCLTRPLIRVE